MDANLLLENSQKISQIMSQFNFDISRFDNVHFCATRSIFEQPRVEGHITINDFPVVKKLKEAVIDYPTSYGMKHRHGQDELITIASHFVGNVVITFEKDRAVYPLFYSHFFQLILKDTKTSLLKNLNPKSFFDKQTIKFINSNKFKRIETINGIPVEILRNFFDSDSTFMKTAATAIFGKVAEGEISSAYLQTDLSEIVSDE